MTARMTARWTGPQDDVLAFVVVLLEELLELSFDPEPLVPESFDPEPLADDDSPDPPEPLSDFVPPESLAAGASDVLDAERLSLR